MPEANWPRRCGSGSPSSPDPRERLGAVGTGLCRLRPDSAWGCSTAFATHPATTGNNHELTHRPKRGGRAVRDPRPGARLQQSAGLLAEDRRPGAEIAVWSAVHGLASLLLDGPLPTTWDQIDFASDGCSTPSNEDQEQGSPDWSRSARLGDGGARSSGRLTMNATGTSARAPAICSATNHGGERWWGCCRCVAR